MCSSAEDRERVRNPSLLPTSLLTGKSYKSKSARSAHFIGVYYVANYCRRYPVADGRRQVYSVVHLGVTSHGNGKSKARQLHFSAGRFGELLRQAPKPYRPHREEFRHGHSAGSRDYSRAIGNRTQGRLACCAAPLRNDFGIRTALHNVSHRIANSNKKVLFASLPHNAADATQKLRGLLAQVDARHTASLGY